MNAQLDEIRTQYEVDKHIAEKKRNHNYFLFALGGCLLLAIALAIWMYYSRKIVRKNRGLYLQIKEQDRLSEELDAMTKQYEQMAQSMPEAADDDDGNIDGATVETQRTLSLSKCASLPGNQQQRQLVARLRQYLLDDHNYTKSDINLDELISGLATNRTYLFEAVKAVTEKTPTEYIHAMQLEEAKQMLETHFELTIEAIAVECGFNSRATFYRLFRERYQINPAEYRRMAKENN
jgi:AraC-like DNA-binding protein